MDVVRNPNHKFMEYNLSMVIDITLPPGGGVFSSCKSSSSNFSTLFIQTHQEVLYIKEIFQVMCIQDSQMP